MAIPHVTVTVILVTINLQSVVSTFKRQANFAQRVM